MSAKNHINEFMWGIVGLGFMLSLGFGGILLFYNVCEIVGPWMKNGQWGDYSTMEDITGEWEVAHDAWHIENLIAGVYGKLPSGAFLLGIAGVIYALLGLAEMIGEIAEKTKQDE